MTTNDGREAVKPVYTIAETAALLGVHRVTVSTFIKSGELRVARLGHRTVRITHEAIMDFLRSREVQEPAASRPRRRKETGSE